MNVMTLQERLFTTNCKSKLNIEVILTFISDKLLPEDRARLTEHALDLLEEHEIAGWFLRRTDINRSVSNDN